MHSLQQKPCPTRLTPPRTPQCQQKGQSCADTHKHTHMHSLPTVRICYAWPNAKGEQLVKAHIVNNRLKKIQIIRCSNERMNSSNRHLSEFSNSDVPENAPTSWTHTLHIIAHSKVKRQTSVDTYGLCFCSHLNTSCLCVSAHWGSASGKQKVRQTPSDSQTLPLSAFSVFSVNHALA